jgi:hypothetical protein
MSTGTALKAAGNEKYTLGNFAEAAALFQRAVAIEPEVPVRTRTTSCFALRTTDESEGVSLESVGSSGAREIGVYNLS